MNTTTATKVNLNRVLNGYYCYNSPGYAHMFEVIRQAPGLWSVKEMHGEPWLVTSLDEARALIAAEVAA